MTEKTVTIPESILQAQNMTYDNTNSNLAATNAQAAIDEINEKTKSVDAATVNGHTVESDVPADAKFTDTVYDDTELVSEVETLKNAANNKVSVRTGNFATVGDGVEIFQQIVAPVSNPLFSRDANGRYMCTSGDGNVYTISVCDDLTTGSWEAIQPTNINNKPIKHAIYSESLSRYYMIAGDTVYMSEDFENWISLTFNTNNLDSMPIKLVDEIDGVYAICDTGEICYISSRNYTSGEPTGIIHEGATDFMILHDFYIIQGNENLYGGIYGGNTLLEKTLETGDVVAVRKIVYWNGRIFGIDTMGSLFMANARYTAELDTSYWVDITTINCLYNNGTELIADEKIDIMVADGELYIVGTYGLYRVNDDLSITSMNSIQMMLNPEIGYATSFTTDDGILYKAGNNRCYMFTYEYEDMYISEALLLAGTFAGHNGTDGEPGEKGDPGVTFTPSVSDDGYLSWENDGGLDNPEPVKINYQAEVTEAITKADEAVTTASEANNKADEALVEIEILNKEAATHVPNTRTIAGVDLTDDVTADELRERLPDFANTSDSYMPNSKAGGLSIEHVMGNVEQKRYEGKQLLPYPYSNMSVFERDGITLTVYDDGTIHIKGTCTAETVYTSFYIQELSLVNGETYTFSDEMLPNTDAYTRLLAYKDDAWVQDISDPSEESATFTYDETVMDTVSLFIRVNTGVTVDVIAKPMLQLGSEATEWEPYVGGTASPNPDYPQDIQNADITEIKCCGKNMYDVSIDTSRTRAGVTATINDDQTMTMNGTATEVGAMPYYSSTAHPMKLKVGDILTLSVKILGGSATIASNTALAYFIVTKNGKIVDIDSTKEGNITGYEGTIDKDTVIDKTQKVTITEDMISDDGYVYISSQTYMREGDVYNDLVIARQVELGSEATDYEPYKSSTSAPAITCRAIEVSADDDYTYEKDGKYYVADTVERTDEGYQLVQRIGEVVFDGSDDENWYYASADFGDIYSTKNYDQENGIPIGLCSHFVYVGNSSTVIGSLALTEVNCRPYFFFAEYGTTTVDDWISWLNENNITYQYILAEPIITQLSDADAIQLLSLKTFDEATRISTNSTVEPVIDVKYGTSEVGAKTLNAYNTALRSEIKANAAQAAILSMGGNT